MLQAFLIGNVGADAQLQAKDGRKFTTYLFFPESSQSSVVVC